MITAYYWLDYRYRRLLNGDIHSPSVFSLSQHLKKPIPESDLALIKTLDRALRNNKSRYFKLDYGTSSNRKLQVNSYHKSSSSGIAKCARLFHISKWQQPNHTLELGSCFGMSTLALYLGAREGLQSMTSVEGCLETLKIARESSPIPETDITWIGEEFSRALESLENDSYDLIYLDGNHSYEATVYYVDLLNKLLSSEGIIILDDIHWSSAMKRAWDRISRSDKFQYAIDMFDLGIVGKGKMHKQYFTI